MNLSRMPLEIYLAVEAAEVRDTSLRSTSAPQVAKIRTTLTTTGAVDWLWYKVDILGEPENKRQIKPSSLPTKIGHEAMRAGRDVFSLLLRHDRTRYIREKRPILARQWDLIALGAALGWVG